MKMFLYRLSLFMFPPLVAVVSCEVYLRFYDSAYEQKLESLELKKDSLELLILGNSHAFNDMDPTQFDLCSINMAGLNQSLYYDKRITLKYIDELPALQVVMINLDYHSLYFSSQGLRDVWTYYSYGILYKEEKYYKERLSYFWFGYSPRVAVSILKNRALEIFGVDDPESRILTEGWQPLIGADPEAFTESRILARAKYFNGLIEDSNEEAEVKKDLEDFISLLRERGITVIIFQAPVSTPLLQHWKKEVVHANDEFIEMLETKYGVMHWDFTQTINNNDLFYNADHLNREGAVNFSAKVNERLSQLLRD